MANATSGEESLAGTSSNLDEVLVFDIESLDGSEEKGGKADMVKDFPHEVM